MKQSHYKVVIVGGGSAGMSVAARLLRAAKDLHGQVAIVDPAEKHYYQPLWTLVGAGAAKKEITERDQASLIPEGAVWMQEAVTEFEPLQNLILTGSGDQITYDYLVVAAGIQVDWNAIPGLRETLGRNGVCSNYSYDTVDSTWESIRQFQGGNAIFTYPNSPIKCGGAPQKIMYLADEYFRKSGVRNRTNIRFLTANPSIFSVKKYADTLTEVVRRKDIQVDFKTHLVEVRGDVKEAVFEHLETGERTVLHYDLLHVVPPMSAPDFLKKSPLADEKGWVDVDPYTLQHKSFGNVFGIGDCSNLPTSKTGAAIRKQAPVVEKNLLALLRGKEMVERYDGYTSCPLVTGYGKLVMAEFDYDQQPQETFPIDQGKERLSMYVLKKDLLPIIYWNGMLKGLL